MNTYLAAINAPMDNDYGQPAAQYITAKSASSTLQQKTTQTQSQTSSRPSNSSRPTGPGNELSRMPISRNNSHHATVRYCLVWQ